MYACSVPYVVAMWRPAQSLGPQCPRSQSDAAVTASLLQDHLLCLYSGSKVGAKKLRVHACMTCMCANVAIAERMLAITCLGGTN